MEGARAFPPERPGTVRMSGPSPTRRLVLRLLAGAGLTMVFCGAESGSDEVLAKMDKGTNTAQILEVAARSREHGIIPEFSFVFGDPHDPEGEIDNTLAFVRRLKDVNPRMELITYFYTPTPQRRGTYGDVDALQGTPTSLDEWTEPAWLERSARRWGVTASAPRPSAQRAVHPRPRPAARSIQHRARRGRGWSRRRRSRPRRRRSRPTLPRPVRAPRRRPCPSRSRATALGRPRCRPPA